ncbi:EthD family reductase [Marinobacter flavimaris]|jgi:uncharacterized protein (TIGR02118 family)|uniref:EthD family reductase n=1 Tax=Marinobacter flavimaris TaxID=262076 RepID=A0A3D8GZ01_9GAMM|nr:MULTISPECIES: EthD family reductase [Marinobacter]MBO6812085.1 EthD family reductase [Marinobacter sp.]MBO6873667.1 EthD family reductase [Marinobacter sp.]PPI78643.1 EthD family reductase [Marinobacter flavimaris]RDU39266.1 EthD family reductase [Marinobacter flavimaris]ROQ42663.1 uncharacterized protein (TIGR02118 family) [Marinobacter sp. 3-2]|tara:strand:- start:5412 stop:5762 length:351 start_codon:yes stop_codon:yes gene_type:complete
MKKLLVLYPRPVDEDGFLTYYREVHLPKALELPGLLSASYSVTNDEGAPFFVYFEAAFRNGPALERAMSSDVGIFLAGDIGNFSPKGAVTVVSDTDILKPLVVTPERLSAGDDNEL